MPECSVVAKQWGELTTAELYSFLKLRTDVFYLEQHVNDEELDNRDREPATVHYWIVDAAAEAIAYLRVLLDPTPAHLDASHIVGRVVVRADHRGQGLAQRLMSRVIEDFEGRALLLHAQEYIAPLYAKVGFTSFGAVYQEAGIPHISMYRQGA